MKKIVFLILLALCVMFFSNVAAEYEYTQEVVKGEFHVFLPSCFKGYGDALFIDLNHPSSIYPSVYFPTVMITFSDEVDSYYEIFYSNSGECIDILKQFTHFEDVQYDYEIVRVGDCAGIMTFRPEENAFTIKIQTSNRKRMLGITITAETREDALSLANGILEHIAAPEMPL